MATVVILGSWHEYDHFMPSCAIRSKTSKKCANRGFVKKFGNNSAF